MEKLDSVVAGHTEHRLLQPERLEEEESYRRQERTERRREHIAELNKRAAETDLRLKRLCDAIERGVADLNDPALKECIADLKATVTRPKPTPTAPRRWPKAWASRQSRPPWSGNSQQPPASASGSAAAAIAANTSAPWPSVLRSPTKKSASWDQRAIYSEHLQLPAA